MFLNEIFGMIFLVFLWNKFFLRRILKSFIDGIVDFLKQFAPFLIKQTNIKKGIP